jgi:pseudouridine-5'-phosphate glycosidase
LGFTGQGIGLSVGMRIFPTMGYAQIHFPSKNGQFNISAEASPLLNTELSFLSYGAKNIITIGYQWNVGKSRRK